MVETLFYEYASEETMIRGKEYACEGLEMMVKGSV